MSAPYAGALDREARRLGRLVAASEVVAGALGEVLAGAADDVAVVELARRIARHVTDSAVLRARLPELREFPVADLVVVPAGWASFADWIRGAAPDGAIELDDLASATIAAGCRGVVADASPAGSPTVRRRVAALGEESRAAADPDLLAELDGS